MFEEINLLKATAHIPHTLLDNTLPSTSFQIWLLYENAHERETFLLFLEKKSILCSLNRESLTKSGKTLEIYWVEMTTFRFHLILKSFQVIFRSIWVCVTLCDALARRHMRMMITIFTSRRENKCVSLSPNPTSARLIHSWSNSISIPSPWLPPTFFYIQNRFKLISSSSLKNESYTNI